MTGNRIRRILLWALAPIGAVIFSLLLSSVALLLIHKSPIEAFKEMITYASHGNQIISILNQATPYYLSALAVAIGFKMNLFNIGVEGQYYLAALLAATFGAAIHLPPPLHVLLIFAVAMGVGATRFCLGIGSYGTAMSSALGLVVYAAAIFAIGPWIFASIWKE